MRSIFVYLTICSVLAAMDAQMKRIPNIIVIPGIICGLCLTGYWLPTLSMLALGMCIFRYPRPVYMPIKKHRRWGGGDVKLMMMAGAFLGWLAIPIMVLTLLMTRIVKKFKVSGRLMPSDRNGIAVAPYALAASIVVVYINELLIFYF